MDSARRRLAAIDGLRGVAVILVFSVHFFGAFSTIHSDFNPDAVRDPGTLNARNALLYWLFYSHYGVYLFFCISGFVVMRSFADVRTVAQWKRFLLRRVLRIYPAFLVSLVIALAIAVAANTGAPFSAAAFIANLVFLNGWFALGIPGYNLVTWSLFFEMVFYVAFPLIYLVAVRRGASRTAIAILWALFVASLAVTGYREWFLFVPFLVGATAGIAPEGALLRWSARIPDVLAVFGYFLATTIGFLVIPLPVHSGRGLDWTPPMPAYLVLVAFAFMALLLRACHSSGWLHRALTIPSIVRFGRISYSFFLTHALIIGVVFWSTARYVDGSFGSALLLLALSFTFSVLVAAALHRFVEVPFQLAGPRAPAAAGAHAAGS